MLLPEITYAGHQYDDVLNLYYAKARMYDADHRRFQAVDPVKGFVTNPLTLVQYLYVVDNPFRYIDYNGAEAADVEGGGNTQGKNNPSTPTSPAVSPPAIEYTVADLLNNNSDGVYAYQLRGFIESLGGTVTWESTKKALGITFNKESFYLYPTEDFWMEDNDYWATDAIIYAALGLDRPTDWGPEFSNLFFSKDLKHGVWYAEVTELQRIFGYGLVFDVAFAMGEDYTNFISFFHHEDNRGNLMEWRIEGWKGNYLYMGVGGEIGLYYRYASPSAVVTRAIVLQIDEEGRHYFEEVKCPAPQHWTVNDDNMMTMSFKLYQGEARPENLIMVRPPVRHWWITGFRPRIEIPSQDLTMVGSITFPRKTMAAAFESNVKAYPSLRGAPANSLNTKIIDTRVEFVWGGSL